MDINLHFYDQEILHQLEIQDYQARGLENLDRVYGQRWELNDPIEIRRQIRDRFNSYEGVIESSLENFLPLEIKRQQSSLRQRWFSPTSARLDRIQRLVNAPHQTSVANRGSMGGLSLTSELEKIKRLEQMRVTRILRRFNGRQLARELDKSSRVTLNQLKTLHDSQIYRANNIIKTETAKVNRRFVKGFIFTAVLDQATTDTCRHWNGQVVNPEEVAPPLHWNCRSTLSYLSNDFDTLVTNGIQPPANLQVQRPPLENMNTWLRRQPRELQIQLVGGEARWALWQTGLVPARAFYTPGGGRTRDKTLRSRARSNRLIYPFEKALSQPTEPVRVSRPVDLINSRAAQSQLRDFYRANSTMALTDIRGTTLAGKRSVRNRPEEFSFDPVTGAQVSNQYYTPNFQVLQERLDFVRRDKNLTLEQRNWIIKFTNDFEDIGVNQQSVVAENLRILFSRYNRDRKRWDNFDSVAGFELNNSVVNVSRILDRRSRDEQGYFQSWGGEEPVVFIGNRQHKLADLQRNRHRLVREQRNWIQTVAPAHTRRLYLTGRAPLINQYVPNLPKDPRKRVADRLFNIRNFFRRDLFKDIKDTLTISPRVYLEDLINAPLLQFQRMRRLLSNKPPSDLEKSLNSSIIQIATGQMTDYDALAIAIGKTLYTDYYFNFRNQANTMRNHHRIGSRVLRDLERRKVIRVNNRGVVRRAILDVDSNRSSGAWKDTVSREVELIDPEFRRFQEINRILYVTDRIGHTYARNRERIRPFQKAYLDYTGNPSPRNVITRRASKKFPRGDRVELLDRDFVRMLNHTNNVEYRVDPTFADFMYSVFSYRDNRGRVKYYDSLNGLRETILIRGDVGLGMMEVIRYHRMNDRPFTVTAQVDSRGRVYYQGYLTPTGGELVRPFIDSGKRKVLTPEGERALHESIGTLLADADQKLIKDVTLSVYRENKAELLKLGRLMSETTQRERRIREYLENPLIQSLDAVEQPRLARLALEVYRIEEHRKRYGLRRPYETRVMIEVDASASGLQMIALATRNRNLANISNLFPSNRKNRVYDIVAQQVSADPRFHKLTREMGVSISWEELAGVSKYQTLLMSYGSGRAGLRVRAASDLQKILGKRNIIVLTRAQELALNREFDRKIRYARRYGDEDTAKRLEEIHAEASEILRAGDRDSIGSNIIAELEEVSGETAELFRKMTANRNPIITARAVTEISDLLSEGQRQISSLPEAYIVFLKDAGDTFARTTGKSVIPWVAFDGKRFNQRYVTDVEHEIRFYDPESGRFIKNIYKITPEDGLLVGKGDIGEVRLGYGVNGTHTNDATIVRQFHLAGRRDNIDTATIHDAIYIHASDYPWALRTMNDLYSQAADADPIRQSLALLRREGLPEHEYQRLLKRGEELGILGANEFEGKDIQITDTETLIDNWYSWGF